MSDCCRCPQISYAISAGDRSHFFPLHRACFTLEETMSVADQDFAAVDANEDRVQAIRDQLREAIIDRRLAPGIKLAENEVGTLFDASRTVVRAALQMLTFEGLVRSERNR